MGCGSSYGSQHSRIVSIKVAAYVHQPSMFVLLCFRNVYVSFAVVICIIFYFCYLFSVSINK